MLGAGQPGNVVKPFVKSHGDIRSGSGGDDDVSGFNRFKIRLQCCYKSQKRTVLYYIFGLHHHVNLLFVIVSQYISRVNPIFISCKNTHAVEILMISSCIHVHIHQDLTHPIQLILVRFPSGAVMCHLGIQDGDFAACFYTSRTIDSPRLNIFCKVPSS